MFQNLKHKTEREEDYKDMDLKSSKRGFHRSPGTNSSVVKGNESRLIRCVHCGFPCDRERDSRANEESWAFLGINYGPQLTAGTSKLSDRRDSTGAQVADNYYERSVLGGCPACGSLTYDKLPQQINNE